MNDEELQKMKRRQKKHSKVFTFGETECIERKRVMIPCDLSGKRMKTEMDKRKR